MHSESSNSSWANQFPDLCSLNDSSWNQALSQVQQVSVPSGTVIFGYGDPCKNYLFVLSGSVKVVSLSPLWMIYGSL